MNAETTQRIIDVSQAVAIRHGIKITDLTRKTHQHTISHARHEAIVEIKRTTGLKNRVIAALFEQDVSMVSYACKKDIASKNRQPSCP